MLMCLLEYRDTVQKIMNKSPITVTRRMDAGWAAFTFPSDFRSSIARPRSASCTAHFFAPSSFSPSLVACRFSPSRLLPSLSLSNASQGRYRPRNRNHALRR